MSVMRKAKKLSKAERLEIGILVNRKYSARAIAAALGRGKTAIADELRRCPKGAYNPHKADAKARLNLRFRRLQWSNIEQNRKLKNHIVQKLEEHWNPDEIAGAMKEEKLSFYASKTAIYEWLQSSRGQQYCRLLYSKRYRKKPHSKNKIVRVMIPSRVSINKRFVGATNRTRYGHWERDTIVSRKGCRGGLSVGVERKSRLVMATKVTSMSPIEHVVAIKNMSFGCLVKSNTFDNGLENKNHVFLGVPSFFADVYSSWQKGSVENANKMIRRYFPKGTNFREVSQREVDRIVSIINRKPRKILGYRSALTVAVEKGVLLTNKSVLIQG